MAAGSRIETGREAAPGTRAGDMARIITREHGKAFTGFPTTK